MAPTPVAEIGKDSQPKPLVELDGRDPKEFALSTNGQGAIRRLVEVAGEIDPAVIVRGAFEEEREELKNYPHQLIKWLEKLSKELKKYNREGFGSCQRPRRAIMAHGFAQKMPNNRPKTNCN